MPLDGLPPLYLPFVFLGNSPPHIVTAIPLEPAAGIVRVDPSFVAPLRERPAGANAKIVERAISTRWCELGVLEPALWKTRCPVRHVPQNTPRTSICCGVSSGLNSGSKFRAIGAESSYPVCIRSFTVTNLPFRPRDRCSFFFIDNNAVYSPA